jgi:hypothetical protein
VCHTLRIFGLRFRQLDESNDSLSGCQKRLEVGGQDRSARVGRPSSTNGAGIILGGDDLYVQGSDEWRAGPSWGLRYGPGKVELSAGRVLHIDHLFARMQRLNTYEAKKNAMTRIGSNLSRVLPPPFSCE